MGRLVRFMGRRVRGVWRFVFSRRMVWTLAILTSLLVVLYQYENWNGARELAEARKKMIARIGTDTYLDLLPEEVPEAENFYAIDEIKSWRVPSPGAAGGFKTVFPAERLLPVGVKLPKVIEEKGCHRLDMQDWLNQARADGKSVLGEKLAAGEILKGLGDGGGLIPKLAAGLSRPKSQIIPSRRFSVLEAGEDVASRKLPYMSQVFLFQKNMEIHLLAAALAEDAVRTRAIFGIMARLGDGFSGQHTLVSNLIFIALNNLLLQSANMALGCPSLQEQDLLEMQRWLEGVDDVSECESTMKAEALHIHGIFNYLKSSIEKGERDNSVLFGPQQSRAIGQSLRLLPVNWIDANNAFALELGLAYCGQAGEEVWRSGKQGTNMAAPQVAAASSLVHIPRWNFYIPNPRRVLGCIMTPAGSGIWKGAAENLFHRRCAILTCALHRHRLAHGGFPEKLAGLDAAFLPEPMKDPAKAGALLNYRKTERGFLLWSVGEDRNDDAGDAGKDWIWRHEK